MSYRTQTPWFADHGPLRVMVLLATIAITLLWAEAALAHAVTLGDKGYIQEITGPQIIPFLYLGAKHMVTGYDHMLFLFGVIFFLYGMKEIGRLRHPVRHRPLDDDAARRLVRLRASTPTSSTRSSASRWFTRRSITSARSSAGSECSQIPRSATLIFGFLHGFGLASKILDYNISPDGLLVNLLAFNVGVEIGQLTALAAILVFMNRWRAMPAFGRQAYTVNVIMMGLGFYLMGFQLIGLAMA